MPPSLSVPADAVLDTGKRAIVYVDRGNGIFEPRRVKTGWNLGGQVEITDGLAPGEKVVVSGNFLIDSESRMAITASGAGGDVNNDPATSGNVPGKPNGKKKDAAVSPGTERSWAEMVDPSSGKRSRRNGDSKSKQELKDSPGKSAASPGVVDWDGPDKEGAPPRDWSGWGKFPGADYLGIKRKTQESTSQQSNTPEAGAEKTAVKGIDGSAVVPAPAPAPAPAPNARSSEMKPGIQNQPASDQPRPSAK